MLKYDYDIKARIGGRKEQQDYSGIASTRFGFLMLVCDGMGGAKGGATASKMAVNIIINGVANSQINDARLSLQNAIQQANFEIFTRSMQDPACKGMGTTVTALLLQEEAAIIAHVGDSRVYQLRNGAKIFRTTDHSKVFEMVKRGILTEEQARTSEESNVILRALGIGPQVEVEIKDNQPYQKKDLFLLCTDGICGAVPEEQFLQVIRKSKDIKSSLSELTEYIDDAGIFSGGSHDNLTAGMVECLSSSTIQEPLDMKSKIIISVLSVLLLLSVLFSSYQVYQVSSIQSKIDSLTRKTGMLMTENENLRKSLSTQEKPKDNAKNGYSKSNEGQDIGTILKTVTPSENTEKGKKKETKPTEEKKTLETEQIPKPEGEQQEPAIKEQKAKIEEPSIKKEEQNNSKKKSAFK